MSGRIYEWKNLGGGPREIRAQVVVIGTGCGGATVAYELAKLGKQVILLEEGGYYHTGTFDNHELNMAGKVSAERNMATTADGTVNIVYGKNVGGASVHYWADSYRTPNDRLNLWHDKFGVLGHSPQDLEPHWKELDETLNVHPAKEEYFNRMNQLVRTASKDLGWQGSPVPQARKNCQKSGHCMQGCMFGAKQSQLITHIPRAMALGVDIYSDTKAVKLEFEGDKVVGLHAVVIDRPSQKESEIKLHFKTDAVVIAAGGFGSSTFLLRNSLKRKLPALGEFLAINPSPFVHALYKEPIIQWRNIPSAYGVEEFRLARFSDGEYKEGGYLIMANQLQPGALGALVPGFGKEHFEIMKDLPHLGGTIGWIDDLDSELGRIEVTSGGKREVQYPFGEITKKILRDCIRKQVILNFKAGAKTVILPDLKRTTLASVEELSKINEIPLSPGSIAMAAPHPAGGCRMGLDPKNSVVDWKHKVHGLKNLFVSDSSVFPTAVSVDPSYTIMAFSKVAARHVGETMDSI
ncbi:GMC oxidoreductase [Leptospira broomii serovar Hurstbridge str. 5399]|uniref:GMC oxidoreductase n=1 Tax=Leptospira broomii serovar Hurstbridge str. 5399 TaxID=1049789 RepID=T0GIK0_9LEPT|nr:GMC family oxidoreductase [Leptospira broomii]EQA45223.1 GMC oxidoreductase [Leptospira broomii serovar Hurstbridge str. 5399]